MSEIPRTFVLTVNRRIPCFDETAAHLTALGVKWERFNGMDNLLCRLNPVDTFDLDRAGDKIGPKHIAATLTHYLLWKVMLYLPEDVFWVLEYDVRLVPDFRERYAQMMVDLPRDWQIVFIGSCCCRGRETRQMNNEVFEVKYPLCGHGFMIRKSALPVLLQEHQKIASPLDIAMMFQSLPKLRTYTILPPLVNQANTYLPP